MATDISPFEAPTILRNISSQQYIQIPTYTLLVYDLCEYKNYPFYPVLKHVHHSNYIRQRGEYNNQHLIHTHVFFTDQIFMGPNIFIFLLEYFLIFTLYHRHLDGVT